jgi:HD superfamily phosphohydrolase
MTDTMATGCVLYLVLMALLVLFAWRYYAKTCTETESALQEARKKLMEQALVQEGQKEPDRRRAKASQQLPSKKLLAQYRERSLTRVNSRKRRRGS